MGLGQELLLNIPPLLLFLIMAGFAVILSIAGLLFVRKLVPHHKLKLHNDVAGPIFGTLGAIYAVLLAFAVVVVWQDFDRANSNVEKEANCLASLYHNAEAFSPLFQKEARILLFEYGRVVVQNEWKALAKGESSPKVGEIVKKLWSLYSNYQPKTETEKIFLTESVHKLNELSEFRSTRIMDSRTGVNPLLWFVLIIGGISTITFTFFFGSENLRAQVAMAVLLGVLICLILFTILSLDFPFTGNITISPKAFKIIVTD